jgi:Zn ribbon nucleic-acid-binding protein
MAMPTKKSKPERGAAVPTRKKLARAAVCPKNAAHTNTRIYKTTDRVVYVVCDECGETWKQPRDGTGDGLDAIDDGGKQFLSELADSLESSPTQRVHELESIVIPVSESRTIVERLRAIIAGS